MITPLTPPQLAWGCYATALVLNTVIALYAFAIVKRLGGDGVFARTARYVASAAAAFAACNAIGMVLGDSAALASVESIGACLLAVGAYNLYTLVEVE